MHTGVILVYLFVLELMTTARFKCMMMFGRSASTLKNVLTELFSDGSQDLQYKIMFVNVSRHSQALSS